MNDPQWLGHAVMLAGFLLLIRSPDDPRSIVGAALLMVTAGFVKHSLFAFPLASTIWLFLTRRRSFWIWAGAFPGFLLLAFGLLYWVYGSDAFFGIFGTPREYHLTQVISRMGAWNSRLSIFLLASLLLAVIDLRSWQTKLALLCVGASALTGPPLQGGAGIVSGNNLFELVISLVMASALAVDRLSGLLSQWEPAADRLRAGGVAALSLILVLHLPIACVDLVAYLRNLSVEKANAEAAVSFLRAKQGPVACEDATFCYWAGKPFEIDFFSIGQRMHLNPETAQDFLDRIEKRRYEAIQIERDSTRLPAWVRERMLRSYVEKIRSHNSIVLERIRDR
jgi:hypothetical protein